jgi:serine/threonine-protein kinase RsbT
VTLEILSRVELLIEAEGDVVRVRQRVRELAQRRKLDSFAVAALTTAVSELTRNVWVHAGKGTAVLEELSDGARFGIRATFRDDGPGIRDLERAMAGGNSTAGSMGLGLSGSKRLVDEFQIETTLGKGTMVRIVKWKPY